MNTKKLWVLLSACLYIVGYVTFVVLFAIIMSRINKYKFYIPGHDSICDDVKNKFKKSGTQFMAYSICGFIVIAGCIVCTLGCVFSL